MKINTTTVNGFGMKGIAGYGAGAWNIGSAPIKMAKRTSQNRKSITRSAHEVRSEKSTVQTSFARRCVSKAPRLWSVLDLAVAAILVVCPLVMGF
ncbi:MAG: hypothetical protein JXR40_07880 [Pontiellaceae bacterium]|nr:hypothetical protein [Pontiellaceae bacterium]